MRRRKKPSEVDLLREELSSKLDEATNEIEGKITAIEEQVEGTTSQISEKLSSKLDEATNEIDGKIAAIQKQMEGTAGVLTEVSQQFEGKSVDIRAQTSKELRESIDEVRSSLETLGLELNNQILDLSTGFEKLNQDTSNWILAHNEQIEEFREKYVTVLEELRQGRNIAVEKEEIMSQKYLEIVNQLKEKEKLALEKEALTQQRIGSLQEEITKKVKEVEKSSTQLEQLEAEIKEKGNIIEELQQKKLLAEEFEFQIKRLKEENEMNKYELERAKTQITTMNDDTKRSVGTTKAVKTFLSESESGRILSHLMSIETANLDELAAMTGIATYTVQQIIQRFRDLGIVTLDETTRKVKLSD